MPLSNLKPPGDQEDRFWGALNQMLDRVQRVETTVDQRKEVMRETIKEAVQESMPNALLSDEEHRWVQLAIKRESQSIAFRTAVIQKSIAGLLLMLAGSVGTGIVMVVRDFAVSHGWK